LQASVESANQRLETGFARGGCCLGRCGCCLGRCSPLELPNPQAPQGHKSGKNGHRHSLASEQFHRSNCQGVVVRYHGLAFQKASEILS
jgi:hypothetical protein